VIELIDGRNQAAPVHIPRPRPIAQGDDPQEVVRTLVEDVRLRGDEALVEHTARLDGAKLDPADLPIDTRAIARARSLVRPELIDALEVSAERLRATCERQRPAGWMDRSGDDLIGELVRPLRRVGIYVPGGRAAYPSSVIMTAVPARVAGVESIALCSPPARTGDISERVLAACNVAGIDEVYPLGGAQAIAALAYGTESVRPVDKIVGAGNIYVRLAKRLVAGRVGVDMEVGSTELAIVAGDDADPDAVAADLIAQAEHGPLGTHALITWSPALAEAVIAKLDTLVFLHERTDDVENALIEGGSAVLVRDLDHALATANALAPEHLQLVFEGAAGALGRVHNAGAVFVGGATPVAVGDYVAGTNHVLPGGGTARFASGLGTHDFVKRTYVFGCGYETLGRLAPHVEALSDAENLHAHARSVSVRLDKERGRR
jgi:histidinol dehydrogenase